MTTARAEPLVRAIAERTAGRIAAAAQGDRPPMRVNRLAFCRDQHEGAPDQQWALFAEDNLRPHVASIRTHADPIHDYDPRGSNSLWSSVHID